MRVVPLWRFLVGEVPPEPREESEQRVLRQLGRQRRITRRETARLCGLSPQQASRLLARMSSAGRISRHGVGRGTSHLSPSGGTSHLSPSGGTWYELRS
ncbi:MAG: MarR family transcriptional regulator [bacterium]|nr:MarR family transcriptional regulator [bacterium]